MCEECGSEKRLLHLAARERLHVQVTVPEKIRSILSGGYESHVINFTNFAYGLEVTQIYAYLDIFQPCALPRFLTILKGNTADDPGCLSPGFFRGFEFTCSHGPPKDLFPSSYAGMFEGLFGEG